MKTDITALPPKINNGVLRRLNAQRGQEMAEAEDISVFHQFRI
ncbi:hypothetical protein L6H05_003869 [Escherichia coli]